MHRTSLIAAAGAAALAVATVSVADAQKPPKPGKGTQAVSLDAKPTTVIFGSASALSGTVTGPQTNGVTVKLDSDDTRPYGDSYRTTGRTAVTAANGKYSFVVKPGVNTQYRVSAQSSPTVTSPARLVLVRIKVGLKVSDSTPRSGSRVLFSGTAFPAHDGRTALIQKRSPTGRWVTVTSTTLKDAGTTYSRYSRRIRVSRDGTYRVKVSGDADHVNGYSRSRAIDVS
jgi:hypothetical protein